MLGSGLTLISNEQRSGRLRSTSCSCRCCCRRRCGWRSDHNVDEFMGKVGAMKAKLDAERVKKVKDNGAADDDDD